ncbi:MAG TPA: diguanylate cyclase, partial [Candidatus Manganitrophaceae bacterium]
SMTAKARILIVEDESLLAEDIEKCLKRLGYPAPEIAYSGEEAILKVMETHPDLALIDIALHGSMDGVEVARQTHERFNTPVVYLVSSLEHEALSRAGVTQPFGYALKPFEERALHLIIEMALYKHRMETRLRESEQWLEATMKSAGDAVIGADAQGRIKIFNSAAELLTGWKRENAVGQKLSEVFKTINEDTRSPIESPAEKLLRERSGASVTRHALLLSKDGTETPIENTAIPIKGADGEMIGAVSLFKDASVRKIQVAALEYHALHDALTDLPNRSFFHNSVEEAILAGQRNNKPLALLLMDLDRFKEINDTLGHHLGDLLLKQIGPRLLSALRESDVIARLGGDEFAALLQGVGEAEHATLVARKILKTLEQPFFLEGQVLHVGASIGIALFPDHGTDADLLIRRADVAMYMAKQSGAGSALYASDQDQYTPRRLALIGELRQAIEDGQLFLLYQPKIDLRTGHVTGVEALARWRHPRLGTIPPDQFIPIAEQTGLIKPLTLWALKTALRQCQVWREAGWKIPVAVNLSVRNLQDPQLPEQIASLLRMYGVTAGSLELEITESVIMADPTMIKGTLARLNDIGAQFSIDDFGAGYSS